MAINIIERKIEGYEKVVTFSDEETNLEGVIVVHNTKLGPSLGGVRMLPYNSLDEAVEDCLRLARGMTLKSASANLKLGGGKAVLIGDTSLKSPEYFKAFGKVIESLNGMYITAEDMNTTTADMALIKETTEHVTGLEGKSGDPSPVTALGSIWALKASLKYRFGDDDLSKYSYAIQGAGSTGSEVIRHLHEAGAKEIYFSDINQNTINEILEKYPSIKNVSNEELLKLEVNALIPCARGGVLNSETIKDLKVDLICGTANNVLLDEQRDSQLLKDRDILYTPDFIANAGGIINVYYEIIGYDINLVKNDVENIYPRVIEILNIAEKQNITTNKAALIYAEYHLK